MKDRLTFPTIFFVMILILNLFYFGINEFNNCDGVPQILSEQSTVEFTEQHKINEIVENFSFIERDPITISSDLQLNNSGFPGIGTPENPILIERYNITATGVDLIFISNTHLYFRISQCLLNCRSLSGHGIVFSNVIHGTIVNNTFNFINDNWGGIVFQNSHNNTINNNTIQFGGSAIHCEDSNNNSIENNHIRNCGTGIALLNSNNTQISINRIFNNTDYSVGIAVIQSMNTLIIRNKVFFYGNGIDLDAVTNSSIIHNHVVLCYNGIGPIYRGSNNNIFSYNVINYCDNYLFSFEGDTYNNIVSYNDLLNDGNPLAFDAGHNNTFANNYWNDWQGVGSYDISGPVSNQDSSPSINAYHISSPVLISPSSDTPILQGIVIIQWNSSSDLLSHPITYSLFYSPSEGKTWMLLASGLSTTNFILDTSLIGNVTSIMLRIQAIDKIGYISQSNSSYVFQLNFGPSKPTIIIPNGGETLQGTVTLKWEESFDSFDHIITYTVYYSSDIGATWILLTSNISSTSYGWDTSTVSNGLSYLIKVVATCSEGKTGEDISDNMFAIQNPEKTKSIISAFTFLLTLVACISVKRRRS